MRPGLLALAVLLLPAAAAQGSSFEMEPPPTEPLRPLADVVKLHWTAELACPAALPGGEPPEFHIWVSSAPAWAHAKFDPDEARLDRCLEGSQTIEGVLELYVDETAPAMAGSQLTYSYSVSGGIGGNASARNAFPLVAAYYSIVSVWVSDTIRVVHPGESAVFPVAIVLHANGATRVAFELLGKAEALEVDLVDPMTLAEGGRRDVEIVVHTKPTATYANEVGVVNLRVTTEHTLDGAPGDTSQVSLLVTTRGFATPAPSLAPALALALALVTSSHRRRMRP